ncbi:MAG: tetratricopeptide repeat protein [Nannocystaceae bacterium]
MSLRAQLDAAATLLDEGAANSAVRMLRSSWEPELPEEDRIPLYCMWIRGLCDTGDLDHALVLAERAADELPREADVLIALGNVYDLRGQLEDARDTFLRAITVDAIGSLQHYNLGAVLERLGEEAEAEGCYRRAIEVDGEGPTLFEANAALGALLRRSGRLEEAAEVYEAYLDEDPLSVEMLVEHGICLSDLDEFEEAIDRFRTALSLDTGHGSAWYNLAITQYRMGQADDAFGSMRNAHEADPGSPLTLAVFGAWTLAQPDADLDKALGLLYGAIDRLAAIDANHLSPSYASLVAEEVFDALWSKARLAEAREVARMAGQRDWITAHMLETLNEADHGRGSEMTTFTVTARAESPSAPEHWPSGAQGYTTGFTVLARDEDEARRYSLEFLRSLEPFPQVQFQIEAVRPGGPDDDVRLQTTAAPRARGVIGVGGRAYFRG